VLMLIVELAIRSIRTEMPLFTDLLHEPIFYSRYILPWVRSSLDNEDIFESIHKSALAGI